MTTYDLHNSPKTAESFEYTNLYSSRIGYNVGHLQSTRVDKPISMHYTTSYPLKMEQLHLSSHECERLDTRLKYIPQAYRNI